MRGDSFGGIMSCSHNHLTVFFCALIVVFFAVTAISAPDIDVWYGSQQSFGHIGQPQDYANILGNISVEEPFSITSLKYSLNGDPNVTLTVGPDGRRLVSDGDFNIDIPWTSLQDGSNTVTITATDSNSVTMVTDVIVDFNSVNVWPLPYTADWSQASTIEDVAQVIDGDWIIESGAVRTAVPGYDRLIGIGDVAWTDYEVTAPVTIHSSSVGGVGLILRWTGHTDVPISGTQPKSGYLPLGEIAWFTGSRIEMYQYGPSKSLSIPTETEYIFKARVETLSDGNTVYSMKVWPAGDAEPESWDLTSTPRVADLANGCAVLITHQCDVSFGNVDIHPLGVRNVSIDVDDTSAAIDWTTDVAADSTIDYGTTTTYTDSVTDSNLVTSHSLELTDLNPNTTYHFMITSEDADANVYQSGDLIFTTTGPDMSGIVSDDFNTQTLDTEQWTFVDPIGDCSYDFAGTGTSDAWLRFHVPAGVDHDPWTDGNRTARIIQDANNTNFEIEAKFESVLNDTYQIQGLMVQQDPNNWIRFDVHYNSGVIKTFVSSFVDLSPTTHLHADIVGANPNANPIWMKVRREGDQWTQWYSQNGTDWTQGAQFYHTLSVSAVGVMAGNAPDASSPGFTCNVDYFFNTDSPIANEDNDGAQPPVLDAIGNQDVLVDQTLEVDIHATDPNNEALFFTPYDLPDFADFNDLGNGNATLTLNPVAGDAGTYVVTVRVTNESAMFDEETFEIHVTNPVEGSGIVSDDFHTGVLNANIWTFINPDPANCSFCLTGANTADAWANIDLLYGPEHQLYTTGLNAPHLVQDVNDTDFEVEVKFESPLTAKYQEQGIIVKRDSNGFMRFEFFSDDSDSYLYARSFELSPASNTTHVYTKVTAETPPYTPPYMRVNRTDDTWTLSYSYNGSDWTVGVSFDYSIEVNQIGFYGGNASGTSSPAHTAQVDYFFNTASPIYDEDPLPDSDQDGITDTEDNCPGTYNPDQNDIDSDGFGDLCDICPELYNPDQNDIDADGVGDICDNCPETYNPDQNDMDSDNIGDICDNCPETYNPDQNDIDSDGFGDLCDICPEIYNPDQNDIDTDGVGDICDNCPETYNPDQNDVDLDGIGDICDNCPSVSNRNQADADADDIGDLCDNCPDHANPEQDDTDNDTIGDACECDAANLDGLGSVDLADYAMVALHWMQAGPEGDTNRDGDVDTNDLEQIAQWWLTDCSP